MKISTISYLKDISRNEEYLAHKNGRNLQYQEEDTGSLTSSLEALAALTRPTVQQRTVLKPKAFLYTSDSSFVSSIPEDKPESLTYVSMDDGYAKIKSGYKPKTLKIEDKKIKSDYISNFVTPSGSIAISSDLKDTISTGSLWQCAGVAFVDKSQKMQTLLHFCPYVSKKTNNNLLRYILSASDPKNLEITIVPGRFDTTDLSIDFIVSRIKKYANGAKISYANFPDDKHTKLILSNGKLNCSDGKNILRKTNPLHKLIFATNREQF